MVIFIDNTRRALRDEIEQHLASAQWAFFAVSFIRDSGIDSLDAPLRAFSARGGQLSVVFGNAFGITEARAIRRLQAFGAQLRYHRGVDTFHPKGYLFGPSAATTAVIVGSSNISASGLSDGVEWNVILQASDCDLRPFVEAASGLWNSVSVTDVTDAVLEELERSAHSIERVPHNQDLRGVLPPAVAASRPDTPLVEFSFRINRSFLQPKSSDRRPITIPIQYNAIMHAHGLDADPIRVYGARGETFSGRIYASNNNQGEYHQIVVNGSSGDAFSLLPLGQQVIVQIVKNFAGVEVRIDEHG